MTSCAGCTVGGVSTTTTATKSTTTTMELDSTEISKTEPTTVAVVQTVDVQQLSDSSKERISQYKEYAVGGLIPGILWEEVAKACVGKASEDEITFGNFTFYTNEKIKPGVTYAQSAYHDFSGYENICVIVFYENDIVVKMLFFCGERVS